MENSKKVDTKNWIPVGNLIMLKPTKLTPAENPFYVREITQDDAFEVIGFGSSFKAEGLSGVLEVGDIVLVIEPNAAKSDGTQMTIGTEEVWFYPPKSIGCILKQDDVRDPYTIIPVNNFLMLERTESETMIGDFVIPASAEEKSTHAIVSILGNGISADGKKYEFDVQVGDEVIISKWTDNEIEINGKKYIIAKESELLAKVSNE